MATIQKISPHLWFDSQAEDAAKFYTRIFKNSKIGRISRYGKKGQEVHHQPEGTALTVEFWIEGQHFLALNGGPLFKFNPSVSFLVNCSNQDEIDYYWDELCVGGDERAQQCGWLKDKFGLSWQIVPATLADMMTDQDQADNVMAAFLPMKKIDLETLNKAFNGVD